MILKKLRALETAGRHKLALLCGAFIWTPYDELSRRASSLFSWESSSPVENLWIFPANHAPAWSVPPFWVPMPGQTFCANSVTKTSNLQTCKKTCQFLQELRDRLQEAVPEILDRATWASARARTSLGLDGYCASSQGWRGSHIQPNCGAA